MRSDRVIQVAERLQKTVRINRLLKRSVERHAASQYAHRIQTQLIADREQRARLSIARERVSPERHAR
jgi:hypothetical protein